MTGIEGRGIQSIEVGGRLLECLMAAEAPMSLKDLATQANLAPAQAHAYLASFRRVELVEQDLGTGQYALGPTAVRLGVARMRSIEPLASASGEAQSLSNELGLMVAVIVEGPKGPTAIQVQQGAENLNINLRAGSTYSRADSASGRVFAAFGRPQSSDPISTAIRRSAMSIMTDSPVPGLSSLAAPVFGKTGSVEMVMSITGKSADLDISNDGRTIAALSASVQRLTAISS